MSNTEIEKTLRQIFKTIDLTKLPDIDIAKVEAMIDWDAHRKWAEFLGFKWP